MRPLVKLVLDSTRGGRLLPAILLVAGAILATLGNSAVVRGEAPVVAVVACDSFSDLRKQITWAGSQAGNPAAAILLESLIAGVTGGKGLVGLDPRRPFAMVVTAEDGQIAVNGYVPVKDMDALLGALETALGPARGEGLSRELPATPFGSVTVREAKGWAILRPSGLRDAASDVPGEVADELVARHTLAVKVFPSRMPPGLLASLGELLRSVAARQPGGQAVDPEELVRAIDTLRQTESMTLGLSIDVDERRLSLENQVVAVAGSDTALAMAEMARGTLSVPLSEVERPLVRGFVAQSLTPAVAASLADAIDATAAGDSADAITRSLLGSMRTIAEAAISSGRLDGAFAIGAASADGPDDATGESGPDRLELTAGLHVRDGRDLEGRLRRLLGPEAGLPAAVEVTLDAETVDGTSVHAIRIDLANTDLARRMGESATAWLAVTPDHCFLLAGGDQRSRLSRILTESSKPPREVKAGVVVQLDVAQAVDLAGLPKSEGDAHVSETKPGGLQLAIRPIERGVAWRLSVDAAAIRTLAATAAQVGLPAGVPQGLPFGGDLP